MPSRPIYLLTIPLRSSDGNFATLSGPGNTLSWKEFQHTAVMIRDTVYELTRMHNEVLGRKKAFINIVSPQNWDARFSPKMRTRLEWKKVGTTSIKKEGLVEIGEHSHSYAGVSI